MEENDTNAFQNTEISWSRSLRFWILITLDIPSITCSLFVLYHLLFDRTLRRALHNHTSIVLLMLALVFQLTDIPWYLNFIRQGAVWPQTPAYCLVWWLVDLGFYNTFGIILAWTSIERHILVFHDRLISTAKKCLFVHYLPLTGLVLYATIYYTILIFFPPCENTYDYTLPVCSATPCHLLHSVLGIWEMGVHGCFCTLIIACFSIALPIRCIVRKRQLNQAFQWKKYRRMLIQLLFISSIYLVFNLPIMMFWLAHQLGLPADVAVEEQLVTFFLTYFVMTLFSIASFMSLPGLKQRIRNLIRKQRLHQATVMPMTRKDMTAPGVRSQYKNTK